MYLAPNTVENQRFEMIQVVQDLRPSGERNREWVLFIDGNRVGWLECLPMACGMECGWVIYTEEGPIIGNDKVWRLENTGTTQVPYRAVQETLLFISFCAS